MRDRLIELLKKAVLKETYSANGRVVTTIHRRIVDMSEVNILADYLLENGVIVPPCKVGDILYDAREYIYGIPCPELYEMKGDRMTIEKGENDEWIFAYDDVYIRHDEIGKTVFLTREEAEKALRKEDEGK